MGICVKWSRDCRLVRHNGGAIGGIGCGSGVQEKSLDVAGWWLQQHRAGTHELKFAGSPIAFEEAVRVVCRENEQGRLQQSSREQFREDRERVEAESQASTYIRLWWSSRIF